MKRAIALGVGVLALAGMSLPSAAADLRRPPPPAPVMAPVPLYNWSGLYVGGHIGGLWADKDWTDVTFGVPFDDGTSDVSGFLAGGQIGFNWQAANWVFGVEFDASWTNADGSHGCLFNVGLTCQTEINWLSTATGRIGYAFNNVLLYVKGGFAWMNEDYSQLITGTGAVFALAEDESRTGWTVGAGVEYGFTPNWSLKLEYNYMDFGNDTFDLVIPGNGAVFTVADIDQQVHILKGGINYRFNWGKAPVARY